MVAIHTVNLTGGPLFESRIADAFEVRCDRIEQTSRRLFDSGLLTQPNVAFMGPSRWILQRAVDQP
jgi:hypothetical protein